MDEKSKSPQKYIKEKDNEKGIPNFWHSAIKNSKFFTFNEKDNKILLHLNDLRIKLNPDKLDYEVEFHFEKNEFFSEDILKISFLYDPKQFEPIKLIGTKISWNGKEKNPAVALIKTKTKVNKKKSSKKNEEEKEKEKIKEEIVPTFFDIFVDNEIEIDEFNNIALYAEFFRDEFIPNALENYMDIFIKKVNESLDENEEEEFDEIEDSDSGNGEGKKVNKNVRNNKGKNSKKKNGDCKNQ
jgi:nucleosome assembly protein 1-like 1